MAAPDFFCQTLDFSWHRVLEYVRQHSDVDAASPQLRKLLIRQHAGIHPYGSGVTHGEASKVGNGLPGQDQKDHRGLVVTDEE